MDELLTLPGIIRDSFLKSDFTGSVSFVDISLGLIITLVLSCFIFFIYKETYSGVVYNHNFNVSLVLVSLITCTMIMTISSNLVLSLGMVGALSIVRFRTAVKDPMDIVFMFWALSLGITTGARLYMVSMTGSFFIGVATVVLLKYKNKNNIFMLIIHYEEEAKDNLLRQLSKQDYTIKSKTVNNHITELTLELKIIGMDTSFVEEIGNIEGVKNISLVSYNGNFVA